MKTKTLDKLQYILPLVVLILFSCQLAWDYHHDGIPRHYLLHDPNLPSFSNWWGLLTVPLVSFFLIYRSRQRIHKNNWQLVPYESRLLFILGLIVAVSFSIGFNQDWAYLHYFALSLIVASLFIPLYKSEFLVGFIIGMVFTFGAVLPIIIGIVYAALFALCYLVIRKGMTWLVRKPEKI
ncbi:hypothetical protein [Spongiivirga citrea]|uniref:Uncharacterized protein n=1 Tax=Spongiivirga citrea TaxID=1481457 RepID=A0A6M0CP63_9FLAO|nr:hypothetical protein [Spongiivirga citrea]NER15720.1 hypothetical protein [Spongiivirga citrea]